METEIWKDIPGYEGLYNASNIGNIKSLSRIDYGGRLIKERIMKQRITKNEYFLVGLSRNGKAKTYNVHQLIAKTFLSNPENKPQVNHIDGDKNNNRIENLEMVTGRENQLHSAYVLRNYVKPVSRYTLDGIYIDTFPSMIDACRNLGVKQRSIYKVCNDKQKSTGGFIWKFS